MANAINNVSYQKLIDSLVYNYINMNGNLPQNQKDLDAFSGQILNHYMWNSDGNFRALIDKLSPAALDNCKVIDKAGLSLTFHSKNSKVLSKDMRVIKLDKKFNAHFADDSKKYVFSLILQHDFKNSCLQYQKQEQGKGKTVTNFIMKQEKVKAEQGSGTFEKDFKRLIAQGQGSDVLVAAKAIMNGLSEGDKVDLGQSLKSSGVKTVNDLESLLFKWKAEAVGQNHYQTVPAPARTMARKRSQSQSMGDMSL
jgi:hypothetical protein